METSRKQWFKDRVVISTKYSQNMNKVRTHTHAGDLALGHHQLELWHMAQPKYKNETCEQMSQGQTCDLSGKTSPKQVGFNLVCVCVLVGVGRYERLREKLGEL